MRLCLLMMALATLAGCAVNPATGRTAVSYTHLTLPTTPYV